MPAGMDWQSCAPRLALLSQPAVVQPFFGLTATLQLGPDDIALEHHDRADRY